MKSGVTIEGIPKLNKILRKIPIEAQEAVAKEMDDVVDDLRQKASDITPVKTSKLQESVFDEANSFVSDKGAKIVGQVGYSKPYALRQHEEMSYHHTAPAQAKFLETPWKQNQKMYAKALIDAAKRAVEKFKKGGV